MQLRVIVLALAMLITGTINTVSTKYQDLVVTGHTADGAPVYFRHPAFQSACMFFGEVLCLIPYFLNKLRNQGSDRHGPNSGKPRSFHVRRALAFAVPALCDAVGSTLLNVGLFYTYASVYQMLRGTLVLFAGAFTIFILRRKLYIHHWLGMVCITAGAALVGAASVINSHQHASSGEGYGEGDGMMQMAMAGASPGVWGTLVAILHNPQILVRVVRDHEGAPAATAPLFGDIMVVLAQLFTALQFILEEKFLSSYQVPPLLAVGMEGAWGMCLCVVALPLLAAFKTADGLPIDDAMGAFREMAADSNLLWAVLGSILSIGLFNFFGISVTKALSGAARATIDACRTLFVWLVCMAIGWEKFLQLQIVGFIVLLAGTSLYNELLKTCLPKPLADLLGDDGGSSSSSSSSEDGEANARSALLKEESADHFAVVVSPTGELQEQLLPKEKRVRHHHHSREGSTSGSAAAGGGSQSGASAAGAKRSAPKPVAIKGSTNDEYSMARSMRMGAQMLNPRALDDLDSYPGPAGALDGGSLTSDSTSVLGSSSPASAAFTLSAGPADSRQSAILAGPPPGMLGGGVGAGGAVGEVPDATGGGARRGLTESEINGGSRSNTGNRRRG